MFTKTTVSEPIISRSFAVFKGYVFPHEDAKDARIYMIPTDRILCVRKTSKPIKGSKHQIWYMTVQGTTEEIDYTMLMPSWITTDTVLKCITGTPCLDWE